MWYLVDMEIRVMFFYWCLYDIYIYNVVQVKSMCVPILRSIPGGSIDSELTKLENMQQLYVLFDVT